MTLNFDDLLKHIGGFGRAQLIIFLVPATIAVLGGLHTLAPIYLLYTPDFRCRPQSSLTPNRSVTNESIYDQPDSFDVSSGKCTYRHGNETGSVCSEWIYDQTEFVRTFVTEFNLVCDNATVGTWIKTCTFAGFMIGVFVTGLLSDLVGRRRCLLACLSVYGTASVGSAFCQSPLTMAIARFFIGFGAIGAFTVGFVIDTEIVSPEVRFHTGMAIQYFWSLGSCIVAGLAYLFNDWRNLQLVTSVPVLLVLLASLPPAVVPESPRWLLHKGRFVEARNVIRRMARLNRAPDAAGRELDSALEAGRDNAEGGVTDQLEPAASSLEAEGDRSQLTVPRWRHRCRSALVAARQLFFQAPRLLAEYGIICFNWFAIALVYYGLTMGTGALPGSVFFTSLLAAMVEFPAYIIGHASVNRLGRKTVYVASLSLSAVALVGLLLVVLLASDISWLIITLSMLGKLFNTLAFGVIYLWTAELYPTSIRNIGVSTSSMCARIGTLFAPALADIQNFVPGQAGTVLAYSIFVGITIAAVLLALFVPETGSRKLPDSLEQMISIRALSSVDVDYIADEAEEEKSELKAADITKL